MNDILLPEANTAGSAGSSTTGTSTGTSTAGEGAQHTDGGHGYDDGDVESDEQGWEGPGRGRAGKRDKTGRQARQGAKRQHIGPQPQQRRRHWPLERPARWHQQHHQEEDRYQYGYDYYDEYS